jgi:hypothetical protein
MEWGVEYADEFGEWWEILDEDEQDSVRAYVAVLRAKGPALGRPHVDSIQGSRHSNMKELRVQHQGRPYRILFAFDPRRVAMLLIGGDKTGNNHWYEQFIPRADAIYDQHLREIERE